MLTIIVIIAIYKYIVVRKMDAYTVGVMPTAISGIQAKSKMHVMYTDF